jgi:hypothetical protein
MKLLFPKQNYNVLSPSSHTHISARDLYISRIGLPILLQRNITHRHMNVKIGIEIVQFPWKEYLNWIFLAVWIKVPLTRRRFQQNSSTLLPEGEIPMVFTSANCSFPLPLEADFQFPKLESLLNWPDSTSIYSFVFLVGLFIIFTSPFFYFSMPHSLQWAIPHCPVPI